MERPRFEYKCPETFAWYGVHIIDFIQSSEGGHFTIRYENQWKEDGFATPEELRKSPEEIDLDAWDPEEGEEIEAKAKSEEHEPFSWWPCTIKCIKNGFYLINFDGWNDQYNEILMKDMLRPRNTRSTINPRKLKMDTVPVPESLVAHFKQFPEEYEELGEQNGLYRINLASHENEHYFKLIGEKKATTLCSKLIPLFCQQKKELLDLNTKLINKEQEIQQKAIEEEQGCFEEFQFSKEVINFVIGRNGSNIQNGEKIEGIRRVTVDDTVDPPVCRILAESEEHREAIAEARDLLEIVKTKYAVPKRDMGKIIGTGGKNIQATQKDAKVKFIKSWEKYIANLKKPRGRNTTAPEMENEDEFDGIENFEDVGDNHEDYSVLVIVGTKDSVALAIKILTMRLEHLREIGSRRTQLSEYENATRGRERRYRNDYRRDNRNDRDGRYNRSNNNNRQRNSRRKPEAEEANDMDSREEDDRKQEAGRRRRNRGKGRGRRDRKNRNRSNNEDNSNKSHNSGRDDNNRREEDNNRREDDNNRREDDNNRREDDNNRREDDNNRRENNNHRQEDSGREDITENKV